MAKLEQVIKAEINPFVPIPELMQVIEAVVLLNPHNETVILNGLAANIQKVLTMYEQKGADNEPLRKPGRDEQNK